MADNADFSNYDVSQSSVLPRRSKRLCVPRYTEEELPIQRLYDIIQTQTLDRLKNVIRKLNGTRRFDLRLSGRKDEVVWRLREELTARKVARDKEGYWDIQSALQNALSRIHLFMEENG
jgi:hypothetical protein